MTLDERIRDDLRSAAGRVTDGSPRGLTEVKRRGLRRRRAKRGAWMTLSAIPVVLFVWLVLPSGPNVIEPAGTDGGEIVYLAGFAVPVTEREPAMADPQVWVGLPGPSPTFDTGWFGPELSFEPGEPSAGDLFERVTRAVYLGEFAGVPLYVYSLPAPSFWDRLFERLTGNFSGDIIGTTLNCCTGGKVDHEDGLAGVTWSGAPGEPDLIVAEWLGLTPEVSVVAYQTDGEFVGWQTPVGGVSSITLGHVPREVVIIAFNAAGEELNRYALPPRGDSAPTSPSDIAGDGSDIPDEFVSGGLVIELSDLPTDLQAVIELSGEDELFQVWIDGEFVYVVLSEQQGHVYAQLCATLSTDDIPEGLQATCLERVVDGEPERGIFRFPEDTEYPRDKTGLDQAQTSASQ